VATGLERRAAADSCVTVLAEADGIVAYVSATEVVITEDGKLAGSRTRKARGVQRYLLQKFRRTNAGTCFNQKPVVKRGQAVRKGDVLADGPATSAGELALGKNLQVAFMPWRGYNFEDAILVSERIVRDDIFTSVHIQEFEVGARDTKLGPEEITRDIPNVGEEALKNLGPDGVVRIGAEVRPGDILVGKITPKSETELAPEERLLRAIFGEKAADVRDTSLTVPSGVYGIVMDVKVTSQQEARRPFLSLSASPEEKKEIRDVEEERKKKQASLEEELTTSLSNILLGEKIPLDVLDVETGEIIIPANRKITKTLLARLAKAHDHIQIENSPVQQKIEEIINVFRPKFAELTEQSGNDFGAELDGIIDEGGVIKQVRVYIAEKKNLSVGDKLAGRHGNKGVVAKIVPDCDMPFLPDGTPVDIVLNPLGVPSRMNLGQLFETYLGVACKVLGFYAATPVFDGTREEEIDQLLRQARKAQEKEIGGNAWLCEDGKTVLYDGRTGDPFDQRVVVGQIYMLKLHHLVTDKIHARATGPYSLVTQQPLGGKAQYGGQRMGEMEVWALEAYGVAYALQELLTVKSDDVGGRTRIYEAIVKGQNTLDAGMPESFSVLMHELRGLCLDMKLLGGETAQPTADFPRI
jgi:DNA-directed RNA polymerase subunit beta